MRKKNSLKKSLRLLQQDSPASDVEIEKEDLEILTEFKDSSFLINSLEENYNSKSNSFRELLPIKLKNGDLKFPVLLENTKQEQDAEEIPVAEIPVNDQKDVKELKVSDISDLCLGILQNPRQNINNLEILFSNLKNSDHKFSKLVVKSLVVVFKDLMPSYKIIKFSQEENVKKETKQVRDFEQNFLKYYQELLIVIENLKDKEFGLKCFIELLKSGKHFNFRNNLLLKIVNFTTNSSKKLIKSSCDCISLLFQEDFSGEISLQVVKMMANLIKKRNYKVSPRVIYTFLDLKLIQEFSQQVEEKTLKRKGEHISRKSRKILKYNTEIENELKEAEAEYDKEEKKKYQSETLKFVFATYFRILKNAPNSLLLEAVLQGLAKFAHLINVEFFNDLLNVLKSISNDHVQAYLDGDDQSITRKNALHCVIAAFQLLSGQGNLNILIAKPPR